MSHNQINIFSDVHFICADWTLLKDNAYLQKILSIANQDTTTEFIMIALTLSYYKKYLSDESAQKKRMKKLKIKVITQMTTALKRNAIENHVFFTDTVKMLLIHHVILNQNLHFAHWTIYLYQLQNFVDQQSNLIMTKHSMWLMTILLLNEKYQFQMFNYDWVEYDEDNSLTKMNEILKTSWKMLYFEYLITIAAKISITEWVRIVADIFSFSIQWITKIFCVILKNSVSEWTWWKRRRRRESSWRQRKHTSWQLNYTR